MVVSCGGSWESAAIGGDAAGAWRCIHAPRAASEERGTFVAGEIERVGERAYRVRVGPPARAALERADGIRGQPGSFGQRLLGKSDSFAVAA
jgi:hypothetical protein